MGMRIQREVEITREDMSRWLEDYDGEIRGTKKMREFLSGKLEAEGFDPGELIDTTTNDSLADGTTLIDMLLLDIESYA